MSLTTAPAAVHSIREGAFGNATHLGLPRLWPHADRPRPVLRLHGVFRPAGGRLRLHGSVTRERIEAGPKNIWRYQPAAAGARGTWPASRTPSPDSPG